MWLGLGRRRDKVKIPSFFATRYEEEDMQRHLHPPPKAFSKPCEISFASFPFLWIWTERLNFSLPHKPTIMYTKAVKGHQSLCMYFSALTSGRSKPAWTGHQACQSCSPIQAMEYHSAMACSAGHGVHYLKCWGYQDQRHQQHNCREGHLKNSETK